MAADAFYVPDGDVFVSTELTRGPWDAHAQHAGPPAALLGRAIQRCRPRDDLMVARVTLDILRPVPITPLSVTSEVVRPGRRVELLHAELIADGLPVMRAAAWRIQTSSLGFSAGLDGPPPPPSGEAKPFFSTGRDVGYHTAMEWRFVRGAWLEPGPATVWLRMRCQLVAGEEPSPLSRVLVAADSGNGVSSAVDYTRYIFINTDLTVHLHRHPAGEWVRLDARTVAQPHGVGMAESALHDEQGVLGRSVQSLLLAERPAPG